MNSLGKMKKRFALSKFICTLLILFSLNLASSLPLIASETHITICHVPPGNPLMRQTIAIDSSAVSTHLDEHNDKRGNCETDREDIKQAKQFVLKTLPRNPNKINFETQSDEVKKALIMIERRELGKLKPIRNLLFDWGKRSDFSTPPLFQWYELYEKAVFTMPDKDVSNLLIKHLTHRFRTATDLLKDRQVNFSSLSNAINEKLNKQKAKKGKSSSSDEAYLILIGLNRLAENISDTRTRELKNALNNEIKNPVKTFWESGNSGGALGLLTFVELIREIKWKDLSGFLKELVTGTHDEEIRKSDFSHKLSEIKKLAEKTLHEINKN